MRTAGVVGNDAARKRAHLVLLDANPLEDIENVRRIAGVMAAGRWLAREDIDRHLADLEIGR